MRTAALIFIIGVLVADDIHQRIQKRRVEEDLRKLYVIDERQSDINDALLSSLFSCRSLADELTSEGMKAIPAKLDPKVIRIQSQRRMWHVARMTAIGGP